MDENFPVFPEANAEIQEGKCKRRQSGILKVSRSPLRTLKEADISQKMEPVGKLRRSSRRVSFAETKEVKEFVTDKMMMIMQDVENGKDHLKENQSAELERDLMPQNTNYSIAGMDALLHAPLRIPLQQIEHCEHIKTVSKHQNFPISGVEIQGDLEETVQSSAITAVTTHSQKIDFKSFLAGIDSTEPVYTTVCFDTENENAHKSFSSTRQNEVPKQQKTIDFKTFLNSIKQSDTDQNKMTSMTSIFEEQIMKQKDISVLSACGTVKNVGTTKDLMKINSNNNLDSNKTVMFLDQDNDMDLTRSHTVAINHFALGNVTTLHSTTVSNNVEGLGTESSTHSPFSQYKTVSPSVEDDMDMTRCHTASIDVRKVELFTNQNQQAAVSIQKEDKSIMPSFTPHEDKLFSDNRCCSKIYQNEALVASKLSSKSVPDLSSFPSDKTIIFSEANDMDITKSHLVTIDSGSLGQVGSEVKGSDKYTLRQSTAGSVLSFFPNDETMVFSEANDMDITKSHTVTIDDKITGQVASEVLGFTRMTSGLTLPGPILPPFSNDKTVVFSEANDMDITKSHTITIDNGSIDQVENETSASTKLISRWSTVGSLSSHFPSDKTILFSEANDMDLTKSHSVPIDNGKFGANANRTVGSNSFFTNDRTVIFSDANDMDITKSHTIQIDSENARQITAGTLAPKKLSLRYNTVASVLSSFPSDKTVVFSEANDMDITKSHTVAIESENLGPVARAIVGPDKKICIENATVPVLSTFPNDKTQVFSEANDMDITKSHTVTIDNGNLGQVRNEALVFTRTSSKHSVPESATSIHSNRTIVFSKANDMDITESHTVAIESGNLRHIPNEALGSMKRTSVENTAPCAQPSFSSKATLGFLETTDMDLTKSHPAIIESENLGLVARPIEKPDKNICIENASVPVLFSFPNDKTLVFSEANDMDITKSHTVTINGGDVGQVTNEALGFRRMTSKHGVPQSISSFLSDKTVVFSEANDMDITKSHTVAIESENLGPIASHAEGSDKKASTGNASMSVLSSFPNDKTLVFSEANDMDITKSHIVTINGGNLGPVVNWTESLCTSFPRDKTLIFSDTNDMDITKSHTVPIISGNIGKVRNEDLSLPKVIPKLTDAGSSLSSFPRDKFTGSPGAKDMDITKSQIVAIESENLGPVARPIVGPDKKFCIGNASTPSLSTFPNDKTLVFSEANDMDITKSHTVTINGGDLGQVTNEALGFRRMTSKHHVPQSISSFCSDKTVVFSEANDMDITKSHTVAIESENLGYVARHTVGSAKKTSVGNASISVLSSFPNNNILAFSEANDMDITKSHTVPVVSGSIGEVRNEDLSLPRMIPKLMDAGSSPLSFPRDKFTRSSEANNMDITKNQTVAAECDGFVSAISESLGSDDMTSRFTAHGSVLPPFPKDKITVSEQVTPVSEIGGMSISSKCDVSSNRQLFQLELEKRQKCSGNLSSNVKFVNIQTTVENTACNVNQAVHTVGTSDPLTRSVEITVLNTEVKTEEDGECVSSMCVNENLNRKEIKESVLSKGNSLDPILKGNNDLEAQEILCQVNQSREAASEELVRHQVSDTQTGNIITDIIEYENTTNKHMGHNQSRKSSLANMQSLQKLNTVTSVTYDSVSERPPVDEKGSTNDQTLDAKSRLLKQSSLINSTFKYNLSLGIFPPKLPIRENLYKAVSSNQHVAKSFGDHLGSDSLLSTMYKSNKFEADSDKLRLNIDLKKTPDIQNKSQVTDHDHIEKIFDQSEPSLSLKSPDLTCLDISEQLGKEASASSEQNENVVSSQGTALGGLKMMKSVEEKLYHKRSWSEVEENRNSCSKKKMRNLGPEDTDSSSQKANNAPVVQWEGIDHKVVEENQLSMTTKSLDSNSSLDSTKGDGASADVANSKCNLNTSLVILEESELHEKLMDGQITVREFFKLLKVQTHAQKSRQSELHVNVELDKSSTVENWLAVKFVHRPKREVYEEDSCALSAAIAGLKDQLLDLDKLLSEVNPSLWKDVMEMTEEELRQFRSCLNAKKSIFVKKTKAICHEQKVELYSAQLNMFKEQRQQRNEYEAYLDDMLQKMDDCLASLDLANLNHLGESSADVIDNDDSITQLEQTVRDRREELKKLQAEHCEVESQLTKVLNEKELQEKAANVWDLKEEFQELLEWTLCLCQDEQAVYTFLYDSLELTLKFGEPVLVDLSPGAKCKRILDINLVSALDVLSYFSEDEAPLHSKLVHELIMTYWKSQDSWQDVYTNELQLPMLLLDVSLVVSRCRLLGDELEYLMNWGSKFDILKTEVQNMDVKCLFSSYDALSKFELTFHIKPGYPWHHAQFTFNSWFGNIRKVQVASGKSWLKKKKRDIGVRYTNLIRIGPCLENKQQNGEI
ncbi:uncharacterized protein knl1 isoform X2 [Chiloscyllium punctatum]|uniref:uncharacterized protein knl1 isoform X2 n=1 Tax=Chiloscyllium punctatum TaxID=137246 RepID=UPI003B63DFA6